MNRATLCSTHRLTATHTTHSHRSPGGRHRAGALGHGRHVRSRTAHASRKRHAHTHSESVPPDTARRARAGR
eukprot:4319245-Prymnesium_polylepis.1